MNSVTETLLTLFFRRIDTFYNCLFFSPYGACSGVQDIVRFDPMPPIRSEAHIDHSNAVDITRSFRRSQIASIELRSDDCEGCVRVSIQ